MIGSPMFKRLALVAMLASAVPAMAADNFVAKDGNGTIITKRAKDTGSGVEADANILLDSTYAVIDPATKQLQQSTLTALGTPFQAGGSIGNTAFGITGLTLVGGKLPVDSSGVTSPVAPTRNSPDVTAVLSLDLTTANATTTATAPAGQGEATYVIPALNGATIISESSSDGGTTWISHGFHQAGVGTFQPASATIVTAGTYRANVNGIGLLRLRTVTTGTGTLAPTLRLTAGSGILNTTSLIVSGVTGGATPFHLVSTASTNATLVATGPHTLYGATLTGLNTTAAYVHVIDSAAANCAATPAHTYLVLGSATAQGGVNVPLPASGEAYVNGLTFCVTGAAADGDTSNGPAGVLVNLSYK